MKELLTRIFIIVIVVLFVVTGLGVGVYGFWQATHQPKTDNSTVKSLQTTDLQVGTGQEAKKDDCLVMKYYGSLADRGQKFDENFSKNTGFKFKLGAGQVIQGWDQGISGMKVGGTRRLVIPSDLGYGAQGSPPVIPANADLVFVIKLESIKPLASSNDCGTTAENSTENNVEKLPAPQIYKPNTNK